MIRFMARSSVNGPGKRGSFNLRVRVPVGVEATVFLPAKDGTPVTEAGKPVESAAGVRLLRREPGVAVLAVGSGQYEFGSES